MSQEKESSSGAPYWVLFLFGIVFMVGGVYVSKNIKIPFIEKLNSQGLPVDLGETIATIGVLLILFPVVNYFFIKPLQTAILDRNNQLERTFEEVEQLRDEMGKMKTNYETRLAASEADARERIQAQIKEAQVLRQTLTAEAEEKAAQMLEQAHQQIEQEKQVAILELRSTVVDLALGATEKLIGANMNDARNRTLVESFVTSEVRS